MEWVLLLTMALSSPPGEVRDVAPVVLPGFTTVEACNLAGKQIADRFVALAGKTRQQQGIAGNSATSIPMINTECVALRK